MNICLIDLYLMLLDYIMIHVEVGTDICNRKLDLRQ